MKIKLQVNGENLDFLENDKEMSNSEYEVIINDIDKKNMLVLESILARAIADGTDEIFNSNTIILK